MALIKKTQRKGFDCEYFRIIQVNCNADRKDAIATFALYKDKATRDEDANAVVDSYQIDLGEDFNTKALENGSMGDKMKASAYEVLKAKAVAEASKEEEVDEKLSFFSDAVSDEK